jgi:hypothetical protein
MEDEGHVMDDDGRTFWSWVTTSMLVIGGIVLIFVWAFVLFGCSTPHSPAITPAAHVNQPDSFDITVSVPRCIETSRQPDTDSGLVALMCLTSTGDGYVGVVMNSQEWSAMKYLANYHAQGGM